MNRALLVQSCSSHLPVACDGLESAIVSAEWDVESHDVLAGLDKVQVLLINASLGGSFVVEQLDLLEETGFVVLVELGSEVFLWRGSEHAAGDCDNETGENETRNG